MDEKSQENKDSSFLLDSINQKTEGSIKWSVLIEIINRIIPPLILVVMARLLSPSEYGTVSTALIVVTLFQTIWDGGFGKALIQTQSSLENSANFIFFSSLLTSIVIYIVVCLFAPEIALFLNSPNSIGVIRILGWQIILTALIVVPQSLFIREFNYRKILGIKLPAAIIPGFISIPLALMGYGIWALVAGYFATSFVNLFFFWKNTSWRPKLKFAFTIPKEILSFAYWSSIETVLGWLIVWGDSLVVSKFLGVNDLGVYRVGISIVNMVFNISILPIIQISYPAFSSLQKQIELLKRNFFDILKIIAFISLPIGLILFFIFPDFVNVIFPDRWKNIDVVIRIFGLTLSLTWLVGLNSELLRAVGKPRVNAAILFITALIYLPVYYHFAHYGLFELSVSRFFLGIIGIIIQIVFVVIHFKFRPLYILENNKIIFLSAFFMFIPLVLFEYSKNQSIFFSLLNLIFSILIYLLSIYFFDRKFLEKIIRMIAKAFK